MSTNINCFLFEIFWTEDENTDISKLVSNKKQVRILDLCYIKFNTLIKTCAQ